MTFEADSAGLAVAAAIRASGAAECRVLVDCFSRLVVSDSFVAGPRYLADAAFRREVHATRALFRALPAEGVGVRATNPIGGNPLRYGARNHKKLIVADDVSYIGGINFSEHNFAWHDLMLRIESAEAADFFARDFAQTWAGQPVPSRQDIGSMSLHSLDGCGNRDGFGPLFAALEGAQASISVFSAYLTFPFLDIMAQRARAGVAVQVLTPLGNNKRVVRDYLVDAALRAGFDIRLLPGMSHLKAILIDGRRLVLGSTNFDFASYWSEEEFYAIMDDEALAAEFIGLVVEPAFTSALPAEAAHVSAARAASARFLLRGAEAVVKAVRTSRRTAIPWR